MPEQGMDKKRCFIITPIGNDNDSIRRHIDGIIDAAIKPALEPDYEVVAAHKITETGTITKQIIKEIYQDELAIANLTGNNPNVMYELAIRYCLGKPVLTIAEKGTSLPFDVMPERTIFYINDPKGSLDLKAAIRKYVANLDISKKGSPIHDIIHEIDADAEVLSIVKSSPKGNLTPVVERQTGVGLQFVAQAPQHHRGMVTVTLHPFGHVLLPQIGPFRAPTGILREPFVIEFVHHEQPVAVAKLVKVFAVRVVRATYVVEAKLLQQPYALLDGAWKGRRPKHSE